MSVRTIGHRLFKHGLAIVRNNINNKFVHNGPNITNKINAANNQIVTATTSRNVQSQLSPRYFGLRNVGVQIGLQARRILIDNVLNRVTNSLAGELRKKAARRILYGDSGPFFALVGVSLASGTGILTKEEELEGVCWEIREAVSKIKWLHTYDEINENQFNTTLSLDDLTIDKPIAKGASAVVYSSNLKTHKIEEDCDEKTRFPFALKMMFNYDIQSNSMAILNAMHKETVPARAYVSNNEWEIDLSNRNRHLPPHPNVVAMYSVFTDFVPELDDCHGLYPAALPARIHPEGEGRNMSLFLLMKRYDTCLKDYLEMTIPSVRTSTLLFAQLLEAIAHLIAHNVAHRDLKSDNLLLDITEPEAPILVITDFGCCLADKSNNLTLPYTSYDVDKGGNTALMAPEIFNQKPGILTTLNYTKSDLWAAGAVAYEMFNCENPFYGKLAKNKDYNEEDLPDLPEQVPAIIRMLITNCLQKNPNKRLHPEVASSVCQLFLWAPSYWLKPGVKIPSSAEILQWLLSLTTKVLCEGKNKVSDVGASTGENFKNAGRRTYPEYLLISSFLCRAKLSNIKAALSWIQSIC